MPLKLAMQGNLQKSIDADIKAIEAAHRAALGRTGGRIRRALVADAKGAGLGRLGNAWRFGVYPGRGTKTLNPALYIYPRGKPGGRTQEALKAHEHGAVIRPDGSRYLAIPTGFNKPRGFRKMSGGTLISPAEMVAMKKWTYTLTTKDGKGLVWFLRVTEAAAKTRGGRIQRLAFAGGMRLGGRVGGQLGSGRGGRVKDILNRGAVPMFILMPQIRIKKRTDAGGIVDRHARALPSLVASEMAKRSREKRNGR